MSNSMDIKPDSELNEGAKDVIRILRWFFTILTVLMIGCLAYYFVSGIFIVEPGEHAAVFRFGALKDVKTKEDWYWAMPKYIDRVEEVSVNKRYTLEHDYFWYFENPKSIIDNPDEAVPDDEVQILIGRDGSHLTADNSILHSKWTLTYIISDVKDYLTRYANPEEVIRLSLTNAVIKASSQLTIDQIQGDGGEVFRGLVKQEFLKQLITKRVGIDILEVNLLKHSVPIATANAFKRVRDAAEERGKALKDAEGYVAAKLETAEAQKNTIEREAEAYRKRIENSVFADANYMKEILPQYRASGASILLTEYVDTLLEGLDKVDQIEIVHPGQDIRVTFEPRLDIKKKPSDEQEEH